MKFQDKFKHGDIICSDRFHNGLCMIVESGKCGFTRNEFRYSCQDLVQENQKWSAYEDKFKPGDIICSDRFHNGFDSYTFNLSYDWRIATDNDIANYLSRFLHIPLGKIGTYDVELTDDGIRLDDGSDYGVYFTAEELVQLGRIINERVVG